MGHASRAERTAAQRRRMAVRMYRSGTPVAVTDDAEREIVRAQVSFYASTPSYRAVLEHHGWGEVGERLSRLASHGQWSEMPREISDEMLAEFAIVGTPSELPAKLHAKYTGLLDRVTLYAPFVPGENDERWRALAAGIHRVTDTNAPAF